MNLFRSAPLLSAGLVLTLGSPLLAQFSSESFESPRYTAGTMPGAALGSGQDGWLLLGPNFPPNLAAVTVQGGRVRSGAQAVRFDASQFPAGSFVELRRNELFTLGTGVLEIEFDFYATSSASPSEWELYSQPYPNPQSCYLRWWIADDGRITYFDTPQRNVVQSNTWVTRDAWHHARSVVDFAADSFEIHLDGALVATGTLISVFGAFPDHGFTEINAYDSGDDQLFVDNFTVRERTAAHGLTLDPPRLPIGRRALVDLRLAGGPSLANRTYVLLASLSGTGPGTPLGSVVLPLRWDGFTSLVAQQLGSAALPGFLGTFNADGSATAQFDSLIPVPAGLLGLHIDFAYVTVAPFDAVSEPAGADVTQ